MVDTSWLTGFRDTRWVRSSLRRLWSPRRGVALVTGGGVLALAALGFQPGQGADVQAFSAPQSAAQNAVGRPSTAAPEPSHVMPVMVFTARHDDGYQVEQRHAGVVAARRSSALGFARSGLLSAVEVNEGDRVAEGSVLARLDTRKLQARAAELRTQISESRNRLDVATISWEQTATVKARSDALAKKEWVSKKAHDDTVYDHRKAVAELAAAESAVHHAEATLASLQVDLDQSVLVAPYAGTIVDRWVDEGAAVTAGEPIMDLIESDAVEFRVGVPEKTAATLDVGAEYLAVVGGQKTPSRLLRLLPQVESATRTVTAIFALSDTLPPPLPGTLGYLISRRTLEESGFWLPLAALTDGRRGLWAAYVVEPEDGADGSPLVGTLSRRDVQMIHVDGDRAFVSGVLRRGEKVVAEGVHRLVPGLRVQAVADASARLGATPAAAIGQ